MNIQPSSPPFADTQISLKLLVESAPVAIALVDGTGQIIYVNLRLEELFGYSRDELLGKLIEVLMPARFQSVHFKHRAQYTQTPHIRSMGSGLDLAGLRKDGSEFPIEAGLSYLEVGGHLMVIATITDLSRRKETEALLEQRVEERTRELERRRQVSDGLREILAILNSNRSLEEILNHIVGQACLLLAADASLIFRLDQHNQFLTIQTSNGISPEAQMPIRMRLTQLVLRQHRLAGDFIIIPGGVLEDEQSVAAATSILSARSTLLDDLGYQAYLIVPIKIKHEIYGGILLCYTHPRTFSPEAIDLATSVGDQTALAIENAHLHKQIEHTAVATERNRIARELHDAVTQTLFSASMIAEVLPRIWQRNQKMGEQKLEELRELTRGALAEMRTLLLELRPTKLVEIELTDLVRQLLDAAAGRARVAAVLHTEGQAEMPPDIKVALYRIAQEALNNVVKHARANQIQIDLQCHPDVITLAVTDDGCGFVFGNVTSLHMGLGIMHERSADIGATLTIESAPGEGTKIVAQWRPS